MAKKTLKHALRSHEARKRQAEHGRKVEEAVRRKALSVQSSARKGSSTIKARSDRAETASVSNDRGSKPARLADKNKVNAFSPNDTILLVGEGNFSFALALLLPPYNHDPARILATAYDTEQQCYEKYPDAMAHVAEIRKRAGQEGVVAFGVDAGALLTSKAVNSKGTMLNPTSSPASWSKIVFNFPHVGAGHKDERRNVMANQLLILRFLISSAPLLTQGSLPAEIMRQLQGKAKVSHDNDEQDDEGETDEEEERSDLADRQRDTVRSPSCAGSILITLRNCKPYTLWDVPTLAKRMTSVWRTIVHDAPSPAKGQRLPTANDVDEVKNIGQGKTFRVWRSFPFEPTAWSGYSHRRTIGWRQGVSKEDNEDIVRSDDGECRTWQLGLAG